MKFLAFALVVAISMIVVVSADDKYTTKYDNVDLEEILHSDRLFLNYFKCLLDKGNCPPDGRELKNVLPDALQTECSKCNDKQKKNAEKVIKFIKANKPQEWKELTAKYDPNNVYSTKYGV